MSKHFRIRTPLPVKVGDVEHTFYVRELGYLHLQDLKDKALRRDDGRDKDLRGLDLIQAVVLECVEEEDGSKAYSADDWHNEIKEVVLHVSKAAMKAQGMDIDKADNDEPPMTEEEEAGNVSPSRRSGTNSASTSAAPSES